MTIIGSNGLTGTLVARNSIRYNVDSLTEYATERITDFIGTQEAFLDSLVWMLAENLTGSLTDYITERITEFIGTEQGFLGPLLWALVENLTDNLEAYTTERIAEFIGAEQDFFSSLAWTLVENLTDNLEELIQADQGFVTTVDTLFYVSIGVLTLGVSLLAVGYIKSAMEQRRAKHAPE